MLVNLTPITEEQDRRKLVAKELLILSMYHNLIRSLYKLVFTKVYSF
jgi:hypothetical protein